jgi:NUMOD3 motif
VNNIYYVYQYLREDGTPYYIGKGKGNRLYSKKHNVNLPIDKTRIQILFENLTQDKAKQIEIDLIKQYGRKDLGTGILRNRTDGGEGCTNPSAEIREKMSAGNKGKKLSEEHKEILRKPKSEETKQKMRKPRPPLTEEHRKNISLAQLGKKRKPHSAETKAKLSLAKKGKPGIPRSEETRQKMRGPRGPQKNPKNKSLQEVKNNI